MGTTQLVSAENSRSIRVFLCHSSGDKPFVRDLYHRLKVDGFEPWLDEEALLPGQAWRDEISAAVSACDVVIVCLSQRSVDKEGFLQREIKHALDEAEEKVAGTIFIIPVRLEEVAVPKRLAHWQWADLFTENGYYRLVAALNTRSQEVNLARTGSPVGPKQDATRIGECQMSQAEKIDAQRSTGRTSHGATTAQPFKDKQNRPGATLPIAKRFADNNKRLSLPILKYATAFVAVLLIVTVFYVLWSKNHQLRDTLESISDPTLKANSAAFEILSCKVEFDLTDWREIPTAMLKDSKQYREVTTNTRSIWRTSKEAKKCFCGTYGTDSPFDPEISSSLEYPVEAKENRDREQAGGKSSERRWNLIYDVREAPLFTPFDIVTRSTAWNARSNPEINREGTLIRIPTRNLILVVNFPKDKLPRKDAFTRYTMPLLDSASPKESAEGKLTIAPDLSSVTWEIPQPKLWYHYVIQWKW